MHKMGPLALMRQGALSLLLGEVRTGTGECPWRRGLGGRGWAAGCAVGRRVEQGGRPVACAALRREACVCARGGGRSPVSVQRPFCRLRALLGSGWGVPLCQQTRFPNLARAG